MNQNSLVSVIIPIFNVEDYLDECMNSVQNQTYSNLEIILVDDGSTDESPRLCDSYEVVEERIKVLHKENGGLMSAWMAGVNASTGDYLCFIDSDDWVDTNIIEELVKVSTGSDSEIICSNYIIEKKNQTVFVEQSMEPGVYEEEEITEKIIPVLLGKEQRSIHSSRCMKLISRKLVADNMKYCNLKVTMGEDLNIILPAILDAKRIVVLEEGFFYHYRFVDTSMVHKYDPRMYAKVNCLYETLEKVIKEKVTDFSKQEMLLQGLKKEYIFLFFYVLKNELRGPAKGSQLRIEKMIRKLKKQAGLENLEVEVNTKANRLLYMIWKHPGLPSVVLGRTAIGLFDRM